MESLRHAFAVTPEAAPDAPLPRSLERLAEAIVARGLETPAMMALETAAPLGFLAGQLLHALQPLAVLFLDEPTMREAAAALEDRRNLRKLVDRIEALAATEDNDK